jgi:hypothetical protein
LSTPNLQLPTYLFRHYAGRDKRGPWLLRFPQTSLSEEA